MTNWPTSNDARVQAYQQLMASSPNTSQYWLEDWVPTATHPENIPDWDAYVASQAQTMQAALEGEKAGWKALNKDRAAQGLPEIPWDMYMSGMREPATVQSYTQPEQIQGTQEAIAKANESRGAQIPPIPAAPSQTTAQGIRTGSPVEMGPFIPETAQPGVNPVGYPPATQREPTPPQEQKTPLYPTVQDFIAANPQQAQPTAQEVMEQQYQPGALTLAALLQSPRTAAKSWQQPGMGYGDIGYGGVPTGRTTYWNEAGQQFKPGVDEQSYWYDPAAWQWKTGGTTEPVREENYLPWMQLPFMAREFGGGQLQYYNASGGPYMGEDESYWFNPDQNVWKKGNLAGEIVDVAAPPWLSGQSNFINDLLAKAGLSGAESAGQPAAAAPANWNEGVSEEQLNTVYEQAVPEDLKPYITKEMLKTLMESDVYSGLQYAASQGTPALLEFLERSGYMIRP